MNSDSSYADTPIDRDLQRIAADLRALPTRSCTERAVPTGKGSWLRRHLHLHTRA